MVKIDRRDVPMFIILLLDQHNSELRELRVNRNKIATVPASLQLNTRCGRNQCSDSQLETTVSWFSELVSVHGSSGIVRGMMDGD